MGALEGVPFDFLFEWMPNIQKSASNITTQLNQQGLYVWIIWHVPPFLGRLRPVIRWSVSSEEALPGGTSSPSISLGPMGGAPYSNTTTLL